MPTKTAHSPVLVVQKPTPQSTVQSCKVGDQCDMGVAG